MGIEKILKICINFFSTYFSYSFEKVTNLVCLKAEQAADIMAGKFEYSLGINELKSKEFRLWQSLIGEFLGKFFLYNF